MPVLCGGQAGAAGPKRMSSKPERLGDAAPRMATVKDLAARLLVVTSLLLTACDFNGSARPTDSCAPGPLRPTQSAGLAGGAHLIFLSTQFTPPREIEQFRSILRSAPLEVDFSSLDGETFSNRLDALQQTGRVRMSLVGGSHADLAPFQPKGYLEDLTALMSRLSDRQFPEPYIDLSRLDTAQSLYVPWTKATYLLVVSKKALPYKPVGANLDALTYDQLKEWGERILRETGQRKLGFPAGPGGLLYRFIQGYLYPSYTGSSVVEFRSADAEKMWNTFAEIWKVTNPASATYDSMQEPLDNDEVWIAWDHIARLITVVKQRSDDFLLVPAPVGPGGRRGFMVVPSGLGIPKQAPNRQGAEKLIDYLTAPEQQLATLCQLGFLPASGASLSDNLPPGLRLLIQTVEQQEKADGAVLPVRALPPTGLGDGSGELNRVYLDAFTRIVRNGEPIQAVLEHERNLLQDLLNKHGADCWPPDPPSVGPGPCLVK
jgi:multiple sugar transport system substrate-binding protein